MINVFLAGSDYADLCPETLQNISVAGLARRFNVSRVHVRSVLRDAEAAGLVMRDSESGRARALPALVDAAEKFFATAFDFLESCAQCALTETEGA
jgi:DNA-binding GntR family transcriptional regulator